MVLSEDYGSREIRVYASGNGGQLINAGVDPIPFNDKTDTSGSWDGTDFTAPETALYRLSGGIGLTSQANRYLYIYKDGVQDKILGFAPFDIPFSGDIYLKRGESISLRLDTTSTLASSDVLHNLSISKVATNQTVAGSPKQVFTGHFLQGQTLAAGGSWGLLDLVSTSDTSTTLDPSYSTTRLIARRSGVLTINAYHLTSDAGTRRWLRVLADGSNTLRGQELPEVYVDGSTAQSLQTYSKIKVIKGDEFQFQFQSNTSGLTSSGIARYLVVSFTIGDE